LKYRNQVVEMPARGKRPNTPEKAINSGAETRKGEVRSQVAQRMSSFFSTLAKSLSLVARGERETRKQIPPRSG
jgi:hypothetical protein